MFFSFDGIDGVGKSTQVQLFCEYLRRMGHDVVSCRDPGSTRVGEAIRRLLLDSGEETPIARRSEMLLYMAARAQLVDEVIDPALSAGKVVVSDRFLLANVVYQGHAGGLDVDGLWQVGAVATGNVAPVQIFLLDMPADEAQARHQREPDRMERQTDGFRRRLRDGFLAEARRRPKQIVIIDATQSPNAVHQAVCAAASPLLGEK